MNKENIRLATIGEIRTNILPNFIAPVPPEETLKAWFDNANIPRMKANPDAKRGGGTVYYSVSGVEKYFRNRLMPGKGPRRVVQVS